MMLSGLFIGLLLLFAVVWVFVMAFKPGVKRVEIRTVDSATGKESVEYRTEEASGGARTAARIVVTILGIGTLTVLGISIALYIMGSST